MATRQSSWPREAWHQQAWPRTCLERATRDVNIQPPFSEVGVEAGAGDIQRGSVQWYQST